MPRRKVVTFNITPQTHVRATQGDKVFFQIPEDQLREEGLKRKKRLVQYNEYKADLRLIADYLGYTMAKAGSHIIFHMPVSKSWSKKKKLAHDGEPHEHKPDADNLIKAFKDALVKQDSTIWDYRVTKLWTNSEEGRIEISSIAIRK
jgi:Holliday junction resolvase RusA-like endonuclease